MIDNLSAEELENTFFGALEYADSEPEIYKNTFKKPVILESYLSVYGCPSDVEKRILKAEVTGDSGIAELYEKYRKFLVKVYKD